MWINDDHEQLQRSMSEPVPVKEKPKIRKVLSQVHDLLSSDEEDQDEEPARPEGGGETDVVTEAVHE